jgi:hypothetical protein
MKNVVINSCFGGFGLSPKAVKRYAELSGFNVFAYTTDYGSGDYNKVIRWNDGDKDMCIYWIKNDIGDTPTSEELNNADWFHENQIPRDDKILVQIVRELKKDVNGRCASLRIVKIPDDVEYEIDEYDGNEHVAEKHRVWP